MDGGCTFGLTGNVIAGDSAELAAFKKATAAKYRLKEKGYATNDIDLILTKFSASEVAVSTGEGYDVYLGTEGLRKVFEEVIHSTIKIDPVYEYVNGDMGYTWANYWVYDKDKEVPNEKFIILFLWENMNGDWRVRGDMYVYGQMEKAAKYTRCSELHKVTLASLYFDDCDQ